MACVQTRWRRLGWLGILILAAGCGGEASEQGAAAGHGQPNAQPPAPVVTAEATHGPIATYHTANATLEPEKQAEILARVSGLVTELQAEEGDRVTEEQVLLRIDDAEYRHRLAQAEAEAGKQKARFERLEQMLARDLGSVEDFETARSDMLSAEATRALAELECSYTRVTTPFAGQVITRSVDLGEMVSPGTPLFVVADLSRLLARIHVPAREFRQIQVDQPVFIALDATEQEIEGRISLVSPVIDPTTPDPVTTFAANCNVGTTGSGYEQGLLHGADALTKAEAGISPNTGFWRADAGLRVVYVSDEPDGSPGNWLDYVDDMRALKADPSLLVASAITGTDGSSAVACYNAGRTASPGTGYVDAVLETGGVMDSICENDWSLVMEDIGYVASELGTVFTLSQVPGDPSFIEVYVNGTLLSSGWSYDSGSNAIVFDDNRGRAHRGACFWIVPQTPRKRADLRPGVFRFTRNEQILSVYACAHF